VVVWLTLELLPLMVRVKVPVPPFELVVTVRVEVLVRFAGGVTGFVLKLEVVLAGNPVTLRLTGPEKPLSDPTVTV